MKSGGILWGHPWEFLFDVEILVMGGRIKGLFQKGNLISCLDKKYFRDKKKFSGLRQIDLSHLLILPPFVNSHVHLELANMKGEIPRRTGMAGFIKGVVGSKKKPLKKNHIKKTLKEIIQSGTLLVGDVCNGIDHVSHVLESPLEGIFFYEVLGLDEKKAGQIFNKAQDNIKRAGTLLSRNEKLHGRKRWHINMSPHSPYSMSLKLQLMVREYLTGKRASVIHFAESMDEMNFLKGRKSPFFELFRNFGLESNSPPVDYGEVAEICFQGARVIVHGTYLNQEDSWIKKYTDGIILCPRSNSYITGGKAPYKLFRKWRIPISLGTDSLASNSDLNILNEMRHAVDIYSISPREAYSLVTMGGARVLGRQKDFGILDINYLAKWIGVSHDLGREIRNSRGIVKDLRQISRFFSKLLEFPGQPVDEVYF